MYQNLSCQVYFNSTQQEAPVLPCGEPVNVADVATDDEGSVRPVVPAAAVALIVVFVGVVIWRRRRR